MIASCTRIIIGTKTRTDVELKQKIPLSATATKEKKTCKLCLDFSDNCYGVRTASINR